MPSFWWFAYLFLWLSQAVTFALVNLFTNGVNLIEAFCATNSDLILQTGLIPTHAQHIDETCNICFTIFFFSRFFLPHALTWCTNTRSTRNSLRGKFCSTRKTAESYFPLGHGLARADWILIRFDLFWWWKAMFVSVIQLNKHGWM